MKDAGVRCIQGSRKEEEFPSEFNSKKLNPTPWFPSEKVPETAANTSFVIGKFDCWSRAMNGEDRDEQHDDRGEREGRHGHCRFNSCRELGFCWHFLARKRVAVVTVHSDHPASASLI